MSKAFVKDGDDQLRASNPLPDRPIPAGANLVTREGLAKIEETIDLLEGEQKEARARSDADAIERTARELRYWSAQRANARVMEPPNSADEVQFGSTIVVERADGHQQGYRIVGIDEAEPVEGTISHISPLARSLMSRAVGDSITVGPTKLTLREIGKAAPGATS
jgi:transcription elongation GreA/GreB family factor